MIGPLGCYQDVYVAKCGRDFTSRSEGVRHERECHACLAPAPYWTVGLLHDPQPEEKLSPYDDLDDAVEFAKRRAACDEKQVLAVWDAADDVVYVLTGGMVLTPE